MCEHMTIKIEVRSTIQSPAADGVQLPIHFF